MAVKAWTATHTGLPSIYSDPDVTITAPGGRTLHTKGAGAPVLVSDALATVGQANTYQVGSATVSVTRPASADPRLAILAGPDGRPTPGVYLPDNQAPLKRSSNITRYETGAVRWPLNPQPIEGSSTLLILDPTLEEQVTQVLYSSAPIYIGPAAPTPGVPLRRVIVQDVSRSRARLGRLFFDVSWVEAARVESGAVPVVTWGEWQAYREGSGDRGDYSYVELASLIAGMPL